MNNYFVILAAGKSKRFSKNLPKQFFRYKNKEILDHSVDKSLYSKLFKKIIIVSNNLNYLKKKKYPKSIAINDVKDFINEKPKSIEKKKSKYIQKKEKGNTWIKKKKKKKSEKGSVDLSEAREVDMNKNGIIDAWLVDENKNGIYEIAYGDENEDGIIEIVAIDKNEDKNFEVILIDKNNNGNADEAEIDEDEDGKTDVIAYDYNEDGEWDKFENV